MTGYHRMGAFATYRKGGLFQMTDSALKDRLGCTMINRKEYLDLRNLHISHYAVSTHVEQ